MRSARYQTHRLGEDALAGKCSDRPAGNPCATGNGPCYMSKHACPLVPPRRCLHPCQDRMSSVGTFAATCGFCSIRDEHMAITKASDSTHHEPYLYEMIRGIFLFGRSAVR